MQITITSKDIEQAIKDYVFDHLIHESEVKITGMSGLPVEIDIFAETEKEAQNEQS